jgi:hypothetical protein
MDLFSTYELDGIQYGAERPSPLSSALFHAQVPACFCEHCVAHARKEGINVKRARQGAARLDEFMQSLVKGKPDLPDGVFAELLRILLQCPEILAWDYQFRMACEDLQQLVFDTVKATQPKAEVGRHIDHRTSSWDLLYRAAVPTRDMAKTCDFLKPILYHEILGQRIRKNYVDSLKSTILSEVPKDQSLALYYSLFNYDPGREPKLDDLDAGFTPDYVYRETKRLVRGAAGKAGVVAGIGVDIPKGGGWGTKVWRSDPDKLHAAVSAAFRAGASGIVISREYEEMHLPSLRVIGRAVREKVEE